MDTELPPDVLEIGRSFYGKMLFVVMTRPAGPDADLKTGMVEHLKHQIELERRGVMFAAGPLRPEGADAWPGTGMFVIRASDFAEARAIAESDPMHKSGARVYDIFQWRLNEGRITLSFDLSQSRAELA